MPDTKTAPLAFNVPIVKPETGFPTPYFSELIDRWLKEKAAAEEAAITLENLGGDPNADRLIIWDDSAGTFVFVTLSEVLDSLSTTHGAILYRDSAAWQALAPGTAGQILQTNGSGADPSWGAGPSFKGALVVKSANQTGANFTTLAPISWNTETYDTDSIHSLSSTVTITIASPGVVTWTGHNFLATSPIVFTTTGALPTGLTAGTTYYVVSPAANTFQVAATPGGAAINTSGSQSGVHTATNESRLIVPSGVSHIELAANVRVDNKTATDWIQFLISKNGVNTGPGLPNLFFEPGSAQTHWNLSSGPLAVSANDYFEAKLQVEADTTIDIIAANSWFSMRVID